LPDTGVPGLAALAEQVAELRGQVLMLSLRLKQAGITGDLDLAQRFEQLAAAVAEGLNEASPKGPPAPRWTGLDDQALASQIMAELERWVSQVLARHYGGYELRPCWRDHVHVVWELSTLAAEWHRIYISIPAPPPGKNKRIPGHDLSRALDFYDRYLPNTMRRVGDFTRRCELQCILRR